MKSNIDIENALIALCRTANSNVYTGSKPTASDKLPSSFIVISIPGNITDLCALNQGYISLYLYAKDKGGRRDGESINNMFKALHSSFPHKNEGCFFDYKSQASFPDKNDYHILALNLKVTIMHKST